MYYLHIQVVLVSCVSDFLQPSTPNVERKRSSEMPSLVANSKGTVEEWRRAEGGRAMSKGGRKRMEEGREGRRRRRSGGNVEGGAYARETGDDGSHSQVGMKENCTSPGLV